MFSEMAEDFGMICSLIFLSILFSSHCQGIDFVEMTVDYYYSPSVYIVMYSCTLFWDGD